MFYFREGTKVVLFSVSLSKNILSTLYFAPLQGYCHWLQVQSFQNFLKFFSTLQATFQSLSLILGNWVGTTGFVA